MTVCIDKTVFLYLRNRLKGRRLNVNDSEITAYKSVRTAFYSDSEKIMPDTIKKRGGGKPPALPVYIETLPVSGFFCACPKRSANLTGFTHGCLQFKFPAFNLRYRIEKNIKKFQKGIDK